MSCPIVEAGPGDAGTLADVSIRTPNGRGWLVRDDSLRILVADEPA
ncbi:MAG: hypothetical protein OXG13_04615 [Gemmatimonadaceae bacterium]|nr:hypothetical protein [Gemmatimonadaceae bacterium]